MLNGFHSENPMFSLFALLQDLGAYNYFGEPNEIEISLPLLDLNF